MFKKNIMKDTMNYEPCTINKTMNRTISQTINHKPGLDPIDHPVQFLSYRQVMDSRLETTIDGNFNSLTAKNLSLD